MHLIAEVAALSRALGACREIADQKNSVAILGSTKLSLAGNRLSLESTDLSMKFATSIEVDGRSDGVAVLNAQRIFDIIKGLPVGAQVELKPAPSQGETSGYTLHSGRSRYRLPSLEADAWVEFPVIAGAAVFTLTTASLRRLLATTSPFTITEGGINSLYGHFLHRDGALLHAVGCNRHILCIASIPAPDGSEELLSGIVIPPYAAKRVLGLADSDIIVSIGETLMSFRWGDSTLTTKMIEGAYIEYQRLIHDGNPVQININSAETKNAIKRAAMISDTSEYGGSRAVRILASDETLTIYAEGGNGEEGEECIRAICSAKGEWGFNSRYLITALEACNGDNATVSLPAENTGGILIRPDGDDGITILVSPMALKHRDAI